MTEDPDIDALVAADRRQLAGWMQTWDAVDPEFLRDRAFRGIALAGPRLLRPFSWIKFRKTFYSDGAALRGYNEAIVDDALDRPWRARDRGGAPVRYWPFRVLHGEITYAHDNRGPMARVHDPLVQRGEVVLGVSRVRWIGRSWVTPTYFVLLPSTAEDR